MYILCVTGCSHFSSVWGYFMGSPIVVGVEILMGAYNDDFLVRVE